MPDPAGVRAAINALVAESEAFVHPEHARLVAVAAVMPKTQPDRAAVDALFRCTVIV